MTKKFLTYNEQIDYLKNNKNIIIDDENAAIETLKKIGYFSLISGYKTPFKNPQTNKYLENTTFEGIVALYCLDENLRELFLKYILKIERHIRSLLSYNFTQKYGERQSEYLNRNNYNIKNNNKWYNTNLDKLILILDKLANENSDYPYINHQREAYNNVPLWVLFNGISFGTLSKFYFFSEQDIRSRVAKEFENVNQKQLDQYLKVLTKFRNVCAHGDRLFSYKTKNSIPDTILHRKLKIINTNGYFIQGKNDLFAIVITLRYLLSNEDFKAFKKNLSIILQRYLNSSYAISTSELYKMMGFPHEWKKINYYKK